MLSRGALAASADRLLQRDAVELDATADGDVVDGNAGILAQQVHDLQHVDVIFNQLRLPPVAGNSVQDEQILVRLVVRQHGERIQVALPDLDRRFIGDVPTYTVAE